jgi:hypothetical protein
MDYRKIITVEPGKHGGKPCVRGLRVTVGDVLGWIGAGMSVPCLQALQQGDSDAWAGRRGLAFKVLYDRPAGELRVLGRWKGKSFTKTFALEQDLAAALDPAKAFVQEQTSR